MEELNADDSRPLPAPDGVSPEIDDRPTLPNLEVPTLPAAIAVPPAPRFDSESERFFASSPPFSLDLESADPGAEEPTVSVDANDEIAAWWAAQRRRTLGGWVATVMALCVALLAAGAR